MQAELRTRLLGIGVITVAVVLAAAWWFREPEAKPLSAAEQAEQAMADASSMSLRPISPFGAAPWENAPATSAGPAAASAPPASPPASAVAAAVPLSAIAPPAGMTAEQWRELQEALKDHPERDAELRRVAQYMAFKDTFDRFQDARAQNGNAAQVRALAQQLDAGIDQRLANAEMSAGEARGLKAAVLEFLEPDIARRTERMQQWVQEQSRNAAANVDVQETAREAQYKQQEAAIVAAWQALPPQQRDQKQLEAQLDALRLRIFSP